jgi:hypothetical protein
VVETRLLPRDVAWFYLRAIALAARVDDELAIASAPRPRELRRLLNIARGCQRVLEVGTGNTWTALALALGEPHRLVAALHSQGSAADRYLELVEPSTRARVDIRAGSPARAPGAVAKPVCLLLIEGSRDPEQVVSAFRSAEGVVRPGALVVFRHYRHPQCPGTETAIALLGLDGRIAGDGLFVWRKPETIQPAEAATPTSTPSRSRVLAAVIGGLAIGAAVWAVIFGSGSDSGTQLDSARVRTQVARQGESTARRPTADKHSQRAKHGNRRASRSRKKQRHKPSKQVSSIKTFSGTGRKKLGSIRVHGLAVLEWTSRRGGLRIDSSALHLDSPAHSGKADISGGIYRDFVVKAPGRWTIRINPR